MSQLDYMPMLKYSKLLIPFALLNENQAQLNHNQSLQRLKERGGLCPSEMLAVIEQTPWQKMDENAALIEIQRYLTRWEVLQRTKANGPLGKKLKEIEDIVCEKIQARKEFGIGKYGASLADNLDSITYLQMLQHAQDEAMDHAIYLQCLIEKATQRPISEDKAFLNSENPI